MLISRLFGIAARKEVSGLGLFAESCALLGREGLSGYVAILFVAFRCVKRQMESALQICYLCCLFQPVYCVSLFSLRACPSVVLGSQKRRPSRPHILPVIPAAFVFTPVHPKAALILSDFVRLRIKHQIPVASHMPQMAILSA
jgi:hypothetical protein